jgi:uncharacterized membrane protein HdeD (DUF308 family)
MATSTQTASVPTRGDFPWWLLLLQGIALLILGLMLLFSPVTTTIAIVIFIGAAWFVSGVLDLVGLISDRSNFGWKLFSGIIGIWAGLVVLGQPLLSAVLLPTIYIIMLAITGLVYGAVRIYRGFKGGGWGQLILGVVTIILSFLLLSEPLAGAFVLPFVFGVFAIVGGIAEIIAAFQAR